MEMRSGPKVSGRSRRVAADQGWSLRGVPLYAVMSQNGVNAASLAVAEQYVDAFSKLAKTSNTILLPEKTGDISSMVAQVCKDRWGCGWGVVSQCHIL